jgi:hypothetical protein
MTSVQASNAGIEFKDAKCNNHKVNDARFPSIELGRNK